MQIGRHSKEDLAVFKLVLDKLEENIVKYGNDYFEVQLWHTTLSTIVKTDDDDDDWDINEKPNNDYVIDCNPFKPIKRLRIFFHSKKDFSRWGHHLENDGVFIGQKIKVVWDHYSNNFSFTMGHDEYEVNLRDNTALNFSKTNEASISVDFENQYRSDILLIKKRLRKLYVKLKRDSLQEKDAESRQKFIRAASQTFPDFVDSLILGIGDTSNEKRDD